MDVCARRAQRPSLLGLCRAAAIRLLKTNVLNLTYKRMVAKSEIENESSEKKELFRMVA